MMSSGSRWTTLYGFLFAIAIVTQHLEIVPVAGYPLTLGLLLGLVILLRTGMRPPLAVVVACVSGITLWVCFSALFDGSFDLAQFSRTLALILLCLVIGTSGLGKLSQSGRESLVLGARIALIAVVVLSVLQVIAGSLGSTVFFNPWGNHQYLYEYEPYLQFNPIPRAQGFFLEPSYDAFVICGLTIALMMAVQKSAYFTLAGLTGVLAARSATGLIVLIAVFLIRALNERTRRSFLPLIGVIVIYLLSASYLSQRLLSIGETSSSANYRLLAPLSVLGDTLSNHPLGRALGALQVVLATFDLRNGASIGTSLDNGLYVMVFYFGWGGVAALLAGFIALCALLARRSPLSVASVWATGSLFFSGGIFLPEFAIMMVFSIRLAATREVKFIGVIGDEFTTPISHSRHIR